ncbi:unnamed protein product [Urochloa decumbens]|uniref:Uncharacterized protein n=1 Tax=Urochloa decumbens TaxID=240449 RepID=A0ABC9H6T9_9POAL
MKGINHGACDYLVKPVRLEQLRGIWMHVVRNNNTDPRNNISIGNDDDDQKLQPGDGDKGEKDGANHTRKYSKKKKKDVDGADEGKEIRTTQKRQRVQWLGELHRKFVEAVYHIGIDRAVPKRILEVMNVDGLSRENVASHLQKYRIYLRKLSEGKLKNFDPLVDGPKAWQINWVPANSNTNVPESSKFHPELGTYQSTQPYVGSPSSSNLFARTNSPSAFGTNTFLPAESIQLMSSQRNLGIPRQDMEPVSSGVNMLKGAVPVPAQDVSRLISSGNSYVPIRSGGLSSASQYFPSNTSNGVVFNTSKPPGSSYASILRGKILGASKGIPFEDIVDGEMLASSGHLPPQSPEFVNQPLVQIQPFSADLFNQVAKEADQFAGPSNSAVPSRFPDLSNNVGMTKGPSQGNIIKINQLSRLAASSGQIPTIGNVHQNQIAGIIGKTTPMVGFSDQVAPFNFGSNTQWTTVPIGNSDLGSSSSTRLALPNPQIDNSVMPTQMLNGGGTSGNLLEGGTINQQAVGDQVINNNGFLVGTSEMQNGASCNNDDFFADWVNEQDFLNNGDPFIGGNWD